VIIPSGDIVTQKDSKTIRLKVKFLHPIEGDYMEMEKPKEFAVIIGGVNVDLLKTLKAE